MDRRGFLITASGALAGSADPQVHRTAPRWPGAGSAPRRVDAAALDRLDARLQDLAHLDDAFGGTRLRQRAAAELATALGLLRHASYSEAIGRRLYASACEAARASAWACFDTGRHDAARDYFATAARASALANDPIAGAYAMSLAAVARYTLGDVRDALRLCESARTAVAGKATPRFSAMLAARTARAHSKAGHRRDCARELQRARDLFARGRRDADPATLYWVDEAEIEMIAGSSALELGDPREAVRCFDAALAARYDPDTQYPRSGAIYLSRAADAHLHLHDLDRAVEAARRALACLEHVGSARSEAAVGELRGKFTAHRNARVVREFLEASTA